jgi:hypothetical protein
MKKLTIASGVIATCLLLNGCATMFGTANRTVNVSSDPSGAQVSLNGQPIGVTPTQVQLASVQGNYIQIQKPGYQAVNTPIATSFQGVGWLNILFWPGFIVDAATGDMMKITNPTITVSLAPIDPSTPSSQPVVITHTSTTNGMMVQTTTISTPIATPNVAQPKAKVTTGS